MQMPEHPQTVDEVIADMDAQDARIRDITKNGALFGAILGGAVFILTEPEDIEGISNLVIGAVEAIIPNGYTVTRSNAQELLELTGIGAVVGGIIGYVGGLVAEHVKGSKRIEQKKEI